MLAEPQKLGMRTAQYSSARQCKILFITILSTSDIDHTVQWRNASHQRAYI